MHTWRNVWSKRSQPCSTRAMKKVSAETSCAISIYEGDIWSLLDCHVNTKGRTNDEHAYLTRNP